MRGAPVFTDHESYDNFVHERSASHDEGGEAGSAPSNPVLWCLWFCRFRIYRTVRYEYLPSPWVALSILGVLSALFGCDARPQRSAPGALGIVPTPLPCLLPPQLCD